MSSIDVEDRQCSEAEERRRHAKEKSKLAQGKAWTVQVDVYLHSETPGDFTIESYLQTTPGRDELVFYNSRHPGFNVEFHLYDETGLGYQFPSATNKQDGIWSKLGSTCPLVGMWDVFPADKTEVKNSGQTLVAFNPNPSPAQGQFQYTLNVSKDGQAPYLPIDPGGNNMNGGTSMD